MTLPRAGGSAYVAVVARDEAVRRRLSRNATQVRVLEWGQLWPLLHSDHPPVALLIATDSLDASAYLLLRNVHRKGILPPTAVCCPGADEDSFARAWAIQTLEARLILPRDDAAGIVREMCAAPIRTRYVLDRFKQLYGLQSFEVETALSILADDRDALACNISVLARKVGMSRSALYLAFTDARLPSPDKVRLLFSIDTAFQAILRRSSLAAAAHCAGYASVRSLRAAATRMGLSLTDLRDARERSWVFDCWLAWVVECRAVVADRHRIEISGLP